MSTPLSAVIQIAVDSTKAKQGADTVEKSMDRVQDATRKTAGALGGFQDKLDDVGGSASTVSQALQSLFAGLSLGVATAFAYKAITDFQDAMIEVANTTGKTGEEMRDLEDRILGLSSRIPATTKSIADLVAAASQLGIRGNANLVEFAEAMERVGAVTDVRGAAGAKSIARLLRASNEPVDVRNFERIGGAINALSDASGAAGFELLGLGTAISQLTERFGMGSEEALAIAAALNRFGIESGSAAIVVGKLFGVMDEQFVKAFGGKNIDAFKGLLQGLKQVKDSGGDVKEVLKEMGLEIDGKTGRAVLALVNGVDQLDEMLRIAKDDAANLKDLIGESDNVFDSATKQAERFWISITNLAVAIGRDLAPAAGTATKEVNDFLSTLYVTDGAVTQLTDRGRILVEVLGAITAGVLLLAAAPIVAWFAALIANVLAASAALGVVLSSALVAVAGLISGIIAFDLGGYFYDEFKIVQQTAAVVVKYMMNAWLGVRSMFSLVGIGVREAWEKTFNFLKSGMADFLTYASDGVEKIPKVGQVAAAAMRGAAVELRNSLKNTDFVKERGELARGVIDEVAQNQRILEATLKNIETEFNGLDRKTGKSWFERFGEGSAKSFASFEENVGRAVELAQEAGKKIEDAVSPKAPDQTDTKKALDGLIGRLEKAKEKTKDVKDETLKYRESLDEMLSALRFEAALIGKTNDERERAEALVKVTSLAMRGYAADQATANAKIREYMDLLGEIQKSKAAFEMREMSDEVQRQISLFGRSRVVRENSSEITDYMAAAMRAYAGDTEKATAATEEFIALLERKGAIDRLQQVADDLGDAFGSVFEDIVFDFENMEQVIEDGVKNIARLVFNQLVTQQVAGFFSSIFGSLFSLSGSGGGGGSWFPGRRASGGGVEPGGNYIVGEDGPEILRLGMRGGYVVPNHVAFPSQEGGDHRRGGGDFYVNMSVNAVDPGSFRRSQRQMARDLAAVGRRYR